MSVYSGAWDPATVVPPLVLGSSNTVASLSGAGTVRGAVRSTPFFSLTGTPTYLYFNPQLVAADSVIFFGICNGAFNVETDVPGSNANSVAVSTEIGDVLFNEASIGTAAIPIQGAACVMALTVTSVWFSADGGSTWNVGGTGGNPATLTGGYPISGIGAGPYYAITTMQSETGAEDALLIYSPTVSDTTIADVFFSATSSFIDFTQVGNRRRFIAVNGGAQNLFPDGSGPFAVAPVVFLSVESADAPITFAQNHGRGGAFNITGPDPTAGFDDPPPVTVTTQSPSSVVPFSAVLGDYLTGNIYAFNPNTLTDNGQQRKWIRRWRALPDDTTSSITFSYLSIDMETGIQVPPGTNPQVVLRWSDDGGHTWSAERITPVGVTGETAFTVKFNRLGSTARFSGSTRIFELSSTDPFKVSIMRAEVLTK